jgi:hypothetical protein
MPNIFNGINIYKLNVYDISTRLMNLNLLPLCYEREISDLVFFFKALFGSLPS